MYLKSGMIRVAAFGWNDLGDWLLFLTFETDQFLFLAMWDFLILH